MPDNSFRPDLSFLNKKVNPDCRVHVTRQFCFDEQTSHTQIPDLRSILTSFAIPVDPDFVGRLDSRVVPPRRDTLARQEMLISAHVRPSKTRLGSLCGLQVSV